jgi:hypothetical protein
MKNISKFEKFSLIIAVISDLSSIALFFIYII